MPPFFQLKMKIRVQTNLQVCHKKTQPRITNACRHMYITADRCLCSTVIYIYMKYIVQDQDQDKAEFDMSCLNDVCSFRRQF